MKDMLPHSEIDRLIDRQEQELDTLFCKQENSGAIPPGDSKTGGLRKYIGQLLRLFKIKKSGKNGDEVNS